MPPTPVVPSDPDVPVTPDTPDTPSGGDGTDPGELDSPTPTPPSENGDEAELAASSHETVTLAVCALAAAIVLTSFIAIFCCRRKRKETLFPEEGKLAKYNDIAKTIMSQERRKADDDEDQETPHGYEAYTP